MRFDRAISISSFFGCRPLHVELRRRGGTARRHGSSARAGGREHARPKGRRVEPRFRSLLRRSERNRDHRDGVLVELEHERVAPRWTPLSTRKFSKVSSRTSRKPFCRSTPFVAAALEPFLSPAQLSIRGLDLRGYLGEVEGVPLVVLSYHRVVVESDGLEVVSDGPVDLVARKRGHGAVGRTGVPTVSQVCLTSSVVLRLRAGTHGRAARAPKLHGSTSSRGCSRRFSRKARSSPAPRNASRSPEPMCSTRPRSR